MEDSALRNYVVIFPFLGWFVALLFGCLVSHLLVSFHRVWFFGKILFGMTIISYYQVFMSLAYYC
jgi:hypothetical protein